MPPQSNKPAYDRIADAVDITSQTLVKMEQNLKTLNDSNILHQTQSTGEHQALLTGQGGIKDKVQELTTKYWYLVLIAFILLACLAGIKEATKFIPIVTGGGG